MASGGLSQSGYITGGGAGVFDGVVNISDDILVHGRSIEEHDARLIKGTECVGRSEPVAEQREMSIPDE